MWRPPARARLRVLFLCCARARAAYRRETALINTHSLSIAAGRAHKAPTTTTTNLCIATLLPSSPLARDKHSAPRGGAVAWPVGGSPRGTQSSRGLRLPLPTAAQSRTNSQR